MQTKKELRTQVETLFRRIDPEELRVTGEKLVTRLIESITWIDYPLVLGFRPLSDEPPLDTLWQYLMDRNIAIGFPKMAGDNIDFYPAASLDEGWHVNYWGIREPLGKVPVNLSPHSPENPALMIVPGRAFDSSGARLGRGRGYYDRYLVDNGSALYKLGICFPWQYFPSVPMTSSDIPVDQVFVSL